MEQVRKMVGEDAILSQRPEVFTEVWNDSMKINPNLSPSTRFERTRELGQKAVNLAQQANPYGGSASFNAPNSGFGQQPSRSGNPMMDMFDMNAKSLPALKASYDEKLAAYSGVRKNVLFKGNVPV